MFDTFHQETHGIDGPVWDYCFDIGDGQEYWFFFQQETGQVDSGVYYQEGSTCWWITRSWKY